jgi:hypothetical protein
VCSHDERFRQCVWWLVVRRSLGTEKKQSIRGKITRIAIETERTLIHIAPETFFDLAQKCWKCSVIGISSPSGVSLLSMIGFMLVRQKANLHPLAFYTIKFTSPFRF